MMHPPSLICLSTAFLLCGGCLSQPVKHDIKYLLPTLVRSPVAWELNNGRSGELKLSPVPPEGDAGLPSPPVPEPLGTEYEVHEAPAAPHNFILQPVARPGGQYPSSTNQKPQVYGTNNHYFINQQGNLVQRPQRPQYGLGQVDSRPPPLNFNESPPSFPHLTDEELYMLGQPVPLHQIQQGNESSILEGEESEASISNPSGVILTESQSNTTDGFPASTMSQSSALPPQPAIPPLPNMPPELLPAHAVSNQPLIPNQPPRNPIHPPSLPNQPSTQSFTSQKQPILPPFQPSISTSQPSITINRPAGVYIATVSYGPSNPSLVYTCVPTEQLKPSLGGYVQGPYGYSCKMSKGRPSLASQILTANNQKPVSQPVVGMEPLSLPIVTPIKFMDKVE